MRPLAARAWTIASPWPLLLLLLPPPTVWTLCACRPSPHLTQAHSLLTTLFSSSVASLTVVGTPAPGPARQMIWMLEPSWGRRLRPVSLLVRTLEFCWDYSVSNTSSLDPSSSEASPSLPSSSSSESPCSDPESSSSSSPDEASLASSASGSHSSSFLGRTRRSSPRVDSFRFADIGNSFRGRAVVVDYQLLASSAMRAMVGWTFFSSVADKLIDCCGYRDLTLLMHLCGTDVNMQV